MAGTGTIMTRAEGRPAWWSMSITRTALRLVPPGAARERWQRELVAELYGLDRGQQARHTLGVVSRAAALRAAVTSRDRLVPEDVMTKGFRCRLGWHKWAHRYTDQHAHYLVCRRCHKQEDPPDFLPPAANPML